MVQFASYFSSYKWPTFSLVFNSEFHAKYLASLTNQNSNFYSVMQFYQKDLLTLRWETERKFENIHKLKPYLLYRLLDFTPVQMCSLSPNFADIHTYVRRGKFNFQKRQSEIHSELNPFYWKNIVSRNETKTVKQYQADFPWS